MVGVNRHGFYSSILATGNSVRIDPIKSESAVYFVYAETGWYREWSIRPFIGMIRPFFYAFVLKIQGETRLFKGSLDNSLN